VTSAADARRGAAEAACRTGIASDRAGRMAGDAGQMIELACGPGLALAMQRHRG
jgi:hypothetical protein